MKFLIVHLPPFSLSCASLIQSTPLRWVHCHHSMARLRVANRGDGLQIWRVAANILNKQSRTADSGWSSSLGVGRGGLTTLPRKTQYLLRITTHSLGTDVVHRTDKYVTCKKEGNTGHGVLFTPVALVHTY
jgi:hypothetical protein